MYMFRKIGGQSMEEMLHPDHRTIDYTGDNAVYTVSTRARQVWVTDPSKLFDGEVPADVNEGFMQAAQKINQLSNEEFQAIRNPDNETVHTPLRDMMYSMWDHVWWDISGFLNEAASGTGHIHPPSHDVLVVNHGETVDKVFDKHTLMAAAYVSPGSTIRVHVGEQISSDEPATSENAAFVFDASESDDMFNKPEVHWIKKDKTVRINVSEKREGSPAGVAAVFVVGAMCDKVNAEDAVENQGSDKDTEDTG